MFRVAQVAAILGFLSLGTLPFTLSHEASAQSTRTVTASARCLEAGASRQPEVAVTLTNQSGGPVTVSYVHGFTTGQVFAPVMRMVDPESMAPVVVQDGETTTITAPWDDLGDAAGSLGGALVVTSAGALVPGCSDRPVDADARQLGPMPATDDEARRKAIASTVQMLGQLESWRAYPALYQLLHPDAQAEVSFAALACWYAGQFGLPGDPLEMMVFGSTVDSIDFGPWTWAVTGESYADAAEVVYTTKVGTIAAAEETTATMHLVAADGQWRWFFGTSPESLAAMPTDCGLA